MSGITGLKQKLHTLPLNYSSDLESAKLHFCCLVSIKVTQYLFYCTFDLLQQNTKKN